MKYILIIVLTFIFFSCTDSTGENNKTTNTNTAGSPESNTSHSEQKPSADAIGCYMKITGRDTAIVMLDQKGNDISGKMLYDNFEKDGSSGSVKGKEDGDILKLYYDFNSEGLRSVTEVYFKKVNGGLLRGIGDMAMKGDTAYFTSGINYSDKEAFGKIDCDLVKGKFQ